MCLRKEAVFHCGHKSARPWIKLCPVGRKPGDLTPERGAERQVPGPMIRHHCCSLQCALNDINKVEEDATRRTHEKFALADEVWKKHEDCAQGLVDLAVLKGDEMYFKKEFPAHEAETNRVGRIKLRSLVAKARKESRDAHQILCGMTVADLERAWLNFLSGSSLFTDDQR